MFDHHEFPGPVGDKIRQRVGPKYFIAEAPFKCCTEPAESVVDYPYREPEVYDIEFRCNWHRMVRAGEIDPEKQPSRNYRFQGGGYAFEKLTSEAESDRPDDKTECEERKVAWPEGVQPSHLKTLAFPFSILPDGKRVWFMPDKKSVALIPDHIWESIRDKAKKSRGKLLAHAYKVSLGVLQLWQGLCPIVEKRRKKLRRLTSEGMDVHKFWFDVDPMGRDGKIEEWVSYWAPNLCENLRSEFKPFLEARKILSKATGITEATVADIVGHA